MCITAIKYLYFFPCSSALSRQRQLPLVHLHREHLCGETQLLMRLRVVVSDFAPLHALAGIWPVTEDSLLSVTYSCVNGLKSGWRRTKCHPNYQVTHARKGECGCKHCFIIDVKSNMSLNVPFLSFSWAMWININTVSLAPDSLKKKFKCGMSSKLPLFISDLFLGLFCYSAMPYGPVKSCHNLDSSPTNFKSHFVPSKGIYGGSSWQMHPVRQSAKGSLWQAQHCIMSKKRDWSSLKFMSIVYLVYMSKS